jgi:hypothetical protein
MHHVDRLLAQADGLATGCDKSPRPPKDRISVPGSEDEEKESDRDDGKPG